MNSCEGGGCERRCSCTCTKVICFFWFLTLLVCGWNACVNYRSLNKEYTVTHKHVVVVKGGECCPVGGCKCSEGCKCGANCKCTATSKCCKECKCGEKCKCDADCKCGCQKGYPCCCPGKAPPGNVTVEELPKGEGSKPKPDPNPAKPPVKPPVVKKPPQQCDK